MVDLEQAEEQRLAQDGPRVPAKKKGGLGCWFWGCLSVIILIIVLAAIIWFSAKAYIGEYTDDAPRELPVAEIQDADLGPLQARWEEFASGLDAGTVDQPLELGADDINALIQNNPAWGDLKGLVFISIDDQDQISGEVSIPLDFLNIPMVEGRYFNGSGVFDISLHDGHLLVFLKGGEVNDKELPSEVLDALRAQNLADGVNKDQDMSAGLQKLEKIEVSGGKLMIWPK